ncbi:hypothetical protein B0H19DRAFT_1257661 [Mycena capillaripes]|nr:hypothetical protein B0H19DRAFT_1257661 [Mycena capillaripes]
MHPALEILEIVEMIVEQVGSHDALPPLGIWKRKFSARHNLSVLARTSKVFLNPALNAPWRDQNTIANLLKCMPADVWDISERANDDMEWPENILSILPKRIIVSADWERPLFYRHRVKSFTLDDDYFLDTLDFFDALSLCLPMQFIFPNLQKLHWMPQPETTFPHIRLFLAPQIKELTLGSMENVSHLCILSNLTVQYPYLMKIDIDTTLVELSIPLLSVFVKASTHLQYLAAPGLDVEAIVHASSLTGLRTFELRRRHLEPMPPLRSCGTSVFFPSLTHLTTPTMEDAHMLLPSPVKRSLVRFRTYTIGSRNTALSRELYIWKDASFPTTLSPDQYHLYTVGGDILKPLLSFTNLVTVLLSHPVGFDLDDSTIRDMASAWPRIQRLYLMAGSYHHVRSRVTLAGLYAFANHCPCLRGLEMTFDATVVPKLAVVKRTQQALDWLEVALSPITQPRCVAKFLAAMFPNLGSIHTLFEEVQHDVDPPQVVNGSNILDSHNLWKRVENVLGSLHD